MDIDKKFILLLDELCFEVLRKRMQQKITQEELALKLACSPKLIRGFESKEKIPSFLKVLQICEVIEFPLGDFLSNIKNP